MQVTKPLLFRLYNKLKTMVKPVKRNPIIYNVNSADESNYRKSALLFYLVKPFLLSKDNPEFLSHQSLKQCRQIATLLGEFGYIVDAVDKRNFNLLKKRNYALVVNARADLKIPDASFGNDAVKIFLATSQNYIVHNRNLRKRHELFYERRRCQVEARRIYSEVMPYIANSEVTIGFGNEAVMGTWKEVCKGPIYPFNNYGFKETEFLPDAKDFSTARRNFLFFASGSQIQKGLDLLLEIFPRHPHLHLYVCSSFRTEGDFCTCYYKELYETPNIHPIGWVRVNSPEFYELMQKCGYVIHPSCSEGQPGSVVQCMYAGLVPLVTKEAGIDTEDFGIIFPNDSLAEIEKVVVEVSQLSESWHRERSTRTRKVAEEKYSEDAFINRWRAILTEILHGAGIRNE
jgi:glycosyltransferase involved in cell wall biosynthesis